MILERLAVVTQASSEFHDITARVEERVLESGVTDGLCYIFSLHTTAGLTINENADPSVRHDILYMLDRMVPEDDPAYRHAEGNSAAHIKASLMGFSVVVPIVNRRLSLGTWQGIYFCEFDGPRHRQVLLVIVPAAH
jgi:secondary thiamine-phosphate synthase enzyme